MGTKTRTFKGLTGVSHSAVNINKYTLRIDFTWNEEPHKAKYCSLRGISTNEEFQTKLDEASVIAVDIKKFIPLEAFTNRLYEIWLPESSYVTNGFAKQSNLTFFELGKELLDSMEVKAMKGRGALSTNKRRKSKVQTAPHLFPIPKCKNTSLKKKGLGAMKITSITHAVLIDLRDHMEDELHNNKKSGELERRYSNKTINDYFGAIKEVIGYAIERGHLKVTENPTVFIKQLPLEEVGELKYHNQEDQQNILDWCEDNNRMYFAYMYAFACWSGLRKEEVIGLAREEIDIENGTVNVVRSYVDNYFDDLKTRKSHRTIKLTWQQIEILKRAMEITKDCKPREFDVMRKKLTGKRINNFVKETFTPVFWNYSETTNPKETTPRPWTASGYRGIWEKRIKKELDNVKPFSKARHTYGTMMLSMGHDKFVLARDMGHTTTEMVDKLYADIRLDLADIQVRIGDLILKFTEAELLKNKNFLDSLLKR